MELFYKKSIKYWQHLLWNIILSNTITHKKSISPLEVSTVEMLIYFSISLIIFFFLFMSLKRFFGALGMHSNTVSQREPQWLFLSIQGFIINWEYEVPV